METIKQVFAWLGVPFVPEKIIGPTTSLAFLGILIDTITMAVSLPSEKLEELIPLLEFWTSRKKCTKRELLSLIGKLSFAAKVIPSGRTFIRRLIDLSTTVQKLDHHISLFMSIEEDLFVFTVWHFIIVTTQS